MISALDHARLVALGGRAAGLARLAVVCRSESAGKRWASKMAAAGLGSWDGETYRPPAQVPEVAAAERTRAPAVCFGECGGWRKARAADGAGVLAVGPSAVCYDGEGRAYATRYELRSLSAVVPSNDPKTFAEVATYPRALQARARGSKASRAQVEAIARAFDPRRLLAPSSAVADGSPVTWRGFVVSGNGRTMAAARALVAPVQREAYAKIAQARWRAGALRDALARAAGPVLVVRELVEADEAAAVQLAGASQSSQAAELSTLEQAQSRARALGIESPADLGPIDWLEPVAADTVRRFIARNGAWWAALLNRADPARRPSLAEPEAAARAVVDVLIGGLPADLLSGGLGDALGQEAMIGALPAVWTLEAWSKAGDLPDSWRLLPHLGTARRWVARAGSQAIKALAVAADADERNGSLFEEVSADAGDLDRLGVALAVGLVRAGRRAAPREAAAGYLARFAERAADFNPRNGSLFGAPDPGDPAAELARIVGFKFARPAPAPVPVPVPVPVAAPPRGVEYAEGEALLRRFAAVLCDPAAPPHARRSWVTAPGERLAVAGPAWLRDGKHAVGWALCPGRLVLVAVDLGPSAEAHTHPAGGRGELLTREGWSRFLPAGKAVGAGEGDRWTSPGTPPNVMPKAGRRLARIAQAAQVNTQEARVAILADDEGRLIALAHGAGFALFLDTEEGM